MIEKLRIDKYLWAIRLYKTRTMSTKACDAGKVKIDGANVKASRLIKVGDAIKIRINHELKTIRVVKLIAKRVGASIAQECYTDITPESDKRNIHRSAFFTNEKRDKGTGRPTKRERRKIEEYKEDDIQDEWDW
ncbi:MAG: RNA-binding S4 domain-containing protein [Saprospiraceae bacterium]|nr:RNA-binding S4 domain-containing protein [Saprospiraceae bacterium]